MKVRLTKQAEADVAEAFEWYERKSLTLAIARLGEAIEQISDDPTLFAPLIGTLAIWD